MAAVTITIKKDTARPILKKLVMLGRDTTPLMRAMGTTFMSITMGNFSSHGAKMRPHPWVFKRDGKSSNLKLHGDLSKAFHLEVGKTTAKLANAKKYAAIHQFGGVIKAKNKEALKFFSGGRWWLVKSVKIPPRPFYPVADGKLTPAAEKLLLKAAERAAKRILGISAEKK